MSDPAHPDITALLRAWNLDGRPGLDRLMPEVWTELRRRARSFLARQRSTETLRPTVMVNELYLRLLDRSEVDWQNRAHFFAFAATVMRRILVDHARARQAAKRGGEAITVTLSGVETGGGPDVEVLDLHAALEELAQDDPELVHLVELRYFAGLTVEETAEVLGLGTATVSRRWAAARAWLYGRLRR